MSLKQDVIKGTKFSINKNEIAGIFKGNTPIGKPVINIYLKNNPNPVQVLYLKEEERNTNYDDIVSVWTV